MLPRKLYELLPYLYILTGVVCAVLVDSTVVLISSMLLIVAGVFVLMMRRSYRKSTNRQFQLYQAASEPDAGTVVEKRSGNERRHRQVGNWPIFNDAGERVFSDRRIAERRVTNA
ncbi:MAG: hypothetical protein HKO86_04105 [Gammaproteobacteria bacterium]|nr:hypothetical protein [Gammaproteobacteria bacterium]NNL06884.1 hypothetical protein [Gammaproteobacteria bacterium]